MKIVGQPPAYGRPPPEREATPADVVRVRLRYLRWLRALVLADRPGLIAIRRREHVRATKGTAWDRELRVLRLLVADRIDGLVESMRKKGWPWTWT